MRTCVIINPLCDKSHEYGHVQQQLDRLRNATIVHALRPGDAAQLTRAALRRGFDTVVAAGGDGTVSGVVEGLGALGAAQLGILPLGRRNELARSLGVPLNLEAALELLVYGGSRPLDVIAVGGTATRYALRRVFGSFGLEPLTSARVTLDSAETGAIDAYSMVITCNGIASGGARPTGDGLLDVHLVPVIPETIRSAAIPLGFRLPCGPELVLAQRARHVHVSAAPSFSYLMDGELLRGPVSQFEIVPNALHVVTTPMMLTLAPTALRALAVAA